MPRGAILLARTASPAPEPMPSPAESAPSPLAQALGRIPSGLFLVTTLDAGRPVGFVGSFVQQVGFEPPTLCVAVGKARGPLAALRASRAFGISILDGASSGVMGRFFRKLEPPATPFDGLKLTTARTGSPLLSEALAWLDCEFAGEHELADHVAVFGRVVDGSLLREGDPSVHLRRNGLSY